MASLLRIIFLTLILNTLCVSSSDIFTNPLKIYELAKEESKFIKNLQSTENGTLVLQKYLKKNYNGVLDIIKEENENIPWDQNELVANPLHVFCLIYRLSIILPETEKLIDENTNVDMTKAISRFQNNNLIKELKEIDLIGSAIGLIRIQHTYELDPYDMALGKLSGRITNARLSVVELSKIVDILYDGNKQMNDEMQAGYALAITWQEGAIRFANDVEGLKKEDLEEMKSLLHEIQYEHDSNFKEPMDTYNTFPVYPNEEFFVQKFDGNESLSWKEMRLKEKEHLAQLPSVSPYWGRDFYSICRGEKPVWSKEPENPNGKICFTKSFSHPFLILQPAKIEVLNEDPTLVQIHDVVPLSWIEQFKNESMNKFGKATIDGDGVQFIRTQTNAWFNDGENKKLKRISKYFEVVTDLSIASKMDLNDYYESEHYQVGVYSPGGVYMPHQDTFIDEERNLNWMGEYIGNRIATIMLYFSDVDGGGTAFTDIGKVAHPRKGSSVFWFNLLSSGEIDESTTHGACPPIYGIKWVANKWIRSYAQIFNRKCDLSEDKRLKLF